MTDQETTQRVTEACEQQMCGNCYKGQDQDNGWCRCACHPAPPKQIPRWSDRLHRFFDFLASGGGSMLVRKDERD